MIKYFCNPDEIEENASEKVVLIEADDVCVFPDIHYSDEKALPVGVAFSTTDRFYPLISGKDIGCGVSFLRFSSKKWKQPFDKVKHYRAFDKASQAFTDEGLGGGNHFLSIETGDDGHTYIICHTGTRNHGIYMYQYLLSLIEEFNHKEGLSGNYLPIESYKEELITKYTNVVLSGVKRRKEFVEKSLGFLIRNNYLDQGIDFEIKDSIHNVFNSLDGKIIHRKGATEIKNDEVVIPISMSRGSLIVKPRGDLSGNLYSCAHGAGRKLSRTATLKYWHSMKKKEKKAYEDQFSELLDRNGKFPTSNIQEFDFAYKDSDTIIKDQPFLREVTKTSPIVTVKVSE